MDNHFFYLLLCWTNGLERVRLKSSELLLNTKTEIGLPVLSVRMYLRVLCLQSRYSPYEHVLCGHSHRYILRVDATNCASEQLPVLELGCGVFGYFMQDRWLKFKDYFARIALYQRGHRNSWPMCKGYRRQTNFVKRWS